MMDGTRISVPLRSSNMNGKKMRKRRELDALVASNGLKRYSGYNGPVCVKPGTNYHDQLLSESTDEQEEYWRARTKANSKRSRPIFKRGFVSVINLGVLIFMLGCLIITGALLWLYYDLKLQTNTLENELKLVVAGNQGIPESLQKCHVETKELQRNQSELFTQFTILSAKMTNLTVEMSSFSGELEEIRAKLIKIYDSTEGFHNYSFSSVLNRIDELNSSVTSLRASENRLEAEFVEFRQNITSLKENLLLLEKVPNKVDNFTLPMADINGINERVNSLYSNVTYLNKSFNSDIQSLKESPFLNSTLVENFNNLLNQNISIRLDTVEDRISQLSTTIYNLQSKNLSNSKVDPNTRVGDAMTVRSNGP